MCTDVQLTRSGPINEGGLERAEMLRGSVGLTPLMELGCPRVRDVCCPTQPGARGPGGHDPMSHLWGHPAVAGGTRGNGAEEAV